MRLELDEPGETFGDGGLAHSRLPDEQYRVGAFAVAEDLEDLRHLGIAPEERRQLILPREVIQIGGEVFEEGRQLEALPETLVALLVVPQPAREPRHDHLGIHAVASNNRPRHTLSLFEHRRQQIGRFHRMTPGTARVEHRESEEELRCRRHLEFPLRRRGYRAHMLFERMQDLVADSTSDPA